MMQETGNNLSSNKKILSIRLWRSGLSFYVSGDENTAAIAGNREVADIQALTATLDDALIEAALKLGSVEYDVVHVFVDTTDTVFAPSKLMAGLGARELLEDAGIIVEEELVIIASDAVEGVGAISTFLRKPVELLQDKFSGKLRFFTPLHELLTASSILAEERRDSILFYPTPSNIYIVRFDEKGALILAETYPCSGEVDAIYYCAELVKKEKGHDVKILFYGERSSSYVAIAKKYFKRVGVLAQNK